MASCETLERLAQHPEWITPRSDVRAFLGEPGAPEATKTTVEPGNAFSPGMRTFGVTWWLCFPESGVFFAPEVAPLESLKWSYEGGYLPLIRCETEVDCLQARHSLFQDGTAGERSEAVCGRLQLTNEGSAPVSVQVFIALRSLGPAGGPVHNLAVGPDGRSLYEVDRHLPLLGLDRSPDAIGCGLGDPSPAARLGRVPTEQAVEDPDGWCFGLARFDVTLAPGQAWPVRLDCPQQNYAGVHLKEELLCTATLRPEQFEPRAESLLESWRARLSQIDVQVPDEDFRNAFFAGLQHMLTAMVGDQPRIAPLAYPLPWLRDGVYISRCFDLAGLHDVARAATECCVRHDFGGGFGAEGDLPGEGLWALVEHYRITRDKEWLARVYPAIQRKCGWLFRMRRAERPIQLVTDTPVMAFLQADRNLGVICLAAEDGIIRGTNDHSTIYSVGWVNHWALCGLREAAYAARELGSESDAETYEREWMALRTALQAFADRHPEFFTYERTANSLLWPTRAWEDAPQKIEAGSNAWWEEHRGTGDHDYKPEPYWLYFELAQAHNALLLGQRERAWRSVQYRLRHQDLPGLYGLREGGAGVGMANVQQGVGLIGHLRGCHKFESITPHGWSQSEMWLLQRAMLVEEWQGALLLFAGVPPHWLAPGMCAAFRDLPTWYGKTSAELQVDEKGHSAIVTASGIAAGTEVRVRLPGREVEGVANHDGGVSWRIDLERH